MPGTRTQSEAATIGYWPLGFAVTVDKVVQQTGADKALVERKIRENVSRRCGAADAADILLLLAQGMEAASKQQPTASQPGRRNKGKAAAAGPEAEVLAVSSNDNWSDIKGEQDERLGDCQQEAALQAAH
eukprot:gene13826-13945_t